MGIFQPATWGRPGAVESFGELCSWFALRGPLTELVQRNPLFSQFPLCRQLHCWSVARFEPGRRPWRLRLSESRGGVGFHTTPQPRKGSVVV